MASYSNKIFREVKGITPSIPSQEVTLKLERPFSEEIRMSILGRLITTLYGLLESLERIVKSGPMNNKRPETQRHRGIYDNCFLKKILQKQKDATDVT